MPPRSANQWSLASRRQRALMATGGVLAATGFGGAIAQHILLFPLMGATGLIVEFGTLVRVRRSAAAVREDDEHAREG
jgi:hypothetical protein